MAEYIEKHKAVNLLTSLENEFQQFKPFEGFEHAMYRKLCETEIDIGKLPAADAAPVVHGRWDDSGRYTFPSGNAAVRCTNCGCALTESEYHLNNWNYCPVCGAKMDGGTDNG